MIKKLVTALICFAFAVVSFSNLASAAWPDALIKELEILKAAGKEKKDMPASIPGVKEIKGEELKKWMDQKVKFVLMDNRLKADYDKEYIVGAQLLTVDELVKNPKLADKYKKDDILVNY